MAKEAELPRDVICTLEGTDETGEDFRARHLVQEAVSGLGLLKYYSGGV